MMLCAAGAASKLGVCCGQYVTAACLLERNHSRDCSAGASTRAAASCDCSDVRSSRRLYFGSVAIAAVSCVFLLWRHQMAASGVDRFFGCVMFACAVAGFQWLFACVLMASFGIPLRLCSPRVPHCGRVPQACSRMMRRSGSPSHHSRLLVTETRWYAVYQGVDVIIIIIIIIMLPIKP
jgi:hypothetical protein